METVATQNTEVTQTVEVAVQKAPSKKSQAVAIFMELLAQRTQGVFTSNKEFRAAVLNQIKTELGVSTASAATMYNSAKKDAEQADETVKLGRDPKKEKPVSTGKRGRPVGSKNKAKEAVAPVVIINPDPAVTEPTAEPVAA